MTWTPTCAWCGAETWDCRHSMTGLVVCSGCIDNAESDGFGHVCAHCGAFAAIEDDIEFGTVDAPHDACPECYARIVAEHGGALPAAARKEAVA